MSEAPDTGRLDNFVIRVDTCVVQLGEHRIKIADAEVEHHLLLRPAEVVAVLRERRPHRRASLLLPDNVTLRAAIEAEMLRVPGGEPLRLARPEEDPTDARHPLHSTPQFRKHARLERRDAHCGTLRPLSHSDRAAHNSFHLDARAPQPSRSRSADSCGGQV